jgi:hypothetical protein
LNVKIGSATLRGVPDQASSQHVHESECPPLLERGPHRRTTGRGPFTVIEHANGDR